MKIKTQTIKINPELPNWILLLEEAYNKYLKEKQNGKYTKHKQEL